MSKNMNALEQYLADFIFEYMPSTNYGDAVTIAIENAPKIRQIAKDLQDKEDAARTMNKDVPPEGVIKWLAKERDKALEKLEQVTGYAKALETRILEMEAAANMAREEYAENIGKARKAAEKAERHGLIQDEKQRKKFKASLARLLEEVKHLAAMEGVVV